MEKVYILNGKRTPIGSYLGSLSTLHPRMYGSIVVKELIKEQNLHVNDIKEVIVGNILPAGLGQGIARQISIDSQIPVTTPAYSINIACGSGMKAVMQMYQSIQSGYYHLGIAGGVESMSGAPFLVPGQGRKGYKMGDQIMKDHMLYDALTDAFDGSLMGVTAENIAAKYHITREDQDIFSYHSQLKAKRARDTGQFKDEIVPITIHNKKGDWSFEHDEYINDDTSLDKIRQLKPAFKKDGTVTAASSSGINDGASFVSLASESYVQAQNLNPMAEIIGIGQGGVDPSVMGLGPTPAIIQALQMASLDLKDIEIIELNEAFAAQALGVIHELSEHFSVESPWILERTNLNGGAIALGHPVGASGNRIIVTLLHQMVKKNKTYGLASLCIGGGMGTAIVLKRS